MRNPVLPANRGIVSSGVTKLDGKWVAAITYRTPHPGYDIPETEDLWRTFASEQEAYLWLEQKLVAMEITRVKENSDD